MSTSSNGAGHCRVPSFFQDNQLDQLINVGIRMNRRSLYIILCLLGTVIAQIGYDESNRTGITQVLRSSKEDTFEGTVLSLLKRAIVVLYFIGALYSFAAIGIICGDYFLPSVDCICSDLNLSQDVAAATFMSFVTTAPEFFVILIATFLTETDIGLGAVVGGGMFNILGVATVGGLAASTSIKLDWWPLFRDSLVYMGAVGILALVLSDGKVTLSESICLIVYYFVYFLLMFFNRRIRKKVKWLIKKVSGIKKKKKISKGFEDKKITVQTPSETANEKIKNSDVLKVVNVNVPRGIDEEPEEKTEEEHDASFVPYFVHYEETISLRRISLSSRGSNFSETRKSMKSLGEKKTSDFPRRISTQPIHLGENLEASLPGSKLSNRKPMASVSESDEKENVAEQTSKEDYSFRTIFCTYPSGSLWAKLSWLTLWTISFLFYWTIPNPRVSKWKRFYPLTFLMCVFWIGAWSYFGTWAIASMGEIFGISDSIMGLTFLALGGSLPEAISTYIMARQGEGGLGFSNSLGGNTMDICLCLGMPWLVKSIMNGSLKIYSEGLVYNALSLIAGIIILIAVGIYTKFNMNRKMGVICCFCYFVFIAVSILVELQIIRFDGRAAL